MPESTLRQTLTRETGMSKATREDGLSGRPPKSASQNEQKFTKTAIPGSFVSSLLYEATAQHPNLTFPTGHVELGIPETQHILHRGGTGAAEVEHKPKINGVLWSMYLSKSRRVSVFAMFQSMERKHATGGENCG